MPDAAKNLADLNPMSAEFVAEVDRLRAEAEERLTKSPRMALVIPRGDMKKLWPGGMRLEPSVVTDAKTGAAKEIPGNVAPVIEKVLPKTKVVECEVSGDYLFVIVE